MKDNFLKGIIRENPIFVGLLSLCPALAMTRSIETALGMAGLTMIALIFTNVIISLTAPFISKEVRIPAYIVIIASFVTILQMLTNAFLPELATTLGGFISLIVVNCVVLGRAESFASKNKAIPSMIDGIGMGLGIVLAFVTIAFFREFLGTGGFEFGVVLPLPEVSFHPLAAYSIPIFTAAPGAFLTLAIILAVINYFSNSKNEKEATLTKAASSEIKIQKTELKEAN